MKSLLPNILDMAEEDLVELFQRYWKKRGLDLLKPAEFEIKVKKSKGKKAKAKKKDKMVSVNKLKQLDAETLALLRKAGLEV